MEKQCKQCNAIFLTYPSHAKRRAFCSKDCKHLYQKGKAFFNSTGIAPWNKGTKGRMNIWNKGKSGIYSEESLQKMRDAKIALDWTGDNHPQWQGGIRKSKGYVMIYSPNHPFKNANNCVLEHRLVMEQHIGRYLTPEEVVHHKNHIKSDNRIENLELFPSNYEHMKQHEIPGRPRKSRR